MRELIIIGCGGFGREVLQIARACDPGRLRWTAIVFIDDHPSEPNRAAVAALGSTIRGPFGELKEARWVEPADVVVAIADPATRDRIVADLRGSAHQYPTLIHPNTTIAPDARIDAGCVIAPGARISTGTRLSRHVHVDQNVTIGHDTSIGAISRLNPAACVAGAVTIEPRVLVGSNATILQGLRVRADAVVGAGSVVTRDVPSATVVKGIPAR